MKILIRDVETTTMDLLIETYQLKNYIKYFNHKNIIRDWSMLGASWMFLGDKEATAIAVTAKDPLNDESVIRRLHKVLESADVLIGHNSDGFDIKKFNTRAVFYGLPPLSPKIQIDTLKIARKHFKFSSNSLAYICQYLGLSLKDESPNWKLILNGDASEIRNMREYNKGDVYATRDLYLKLMSWHHTHPNVSGITRDVMGEEVDTCNKCSSSNVIRRGYHNLTSGRRRQRYRCMDCGGWQAGKLI